MRFAAKFRKNQRINKILSIGNRILLFACTLSNKACCTVHIWPIFLTHFLLYHAGISGWAHIIGFCESFFVVDVPICPRFVKLVFNICRLQKICKTSWDNVFGNAIFFQDFHARMMLYGMLPNPISNACFSNWNDLHVAPSHDSKIDYWWLQHWKSHLFCILKRHYLVHWNYSTPLNVEQELKLVAFCLKRTHSSTKTQGFRGNIKNKPTIWTRAKCRR